MEIGQLNHPQRRQKGKRTIKTIDQPQPHRKARRTLKTIVEPVPVRNAPGRQKQLASGKPSTSNKCLADGSSVPARAQKSSRVAKCEKVVPQEYRADAVRYKWMTEQEMRKRNVEHSMHVSRWMHRAPASPTTTPVAKTSHPRKKANQSSTSTKTAAPIMGQKELLRRRARKQLKKKAYRISQVEIDFRGFENSAW